MGLNTALHSYLNQYMLSPHSCLTPISLLPMPTPETVQVIDPQYEDIWSAAIQEYEKNTKVALPAKLNSMDDVHHLVEE